MTLRCLSASRSAQRLGGGFLATLFGLSLAATAQQAPQSGSRASSEGEGETILLSPFEISAEKEHGYQAVSTLSGGRIQTDLKDTPATISIITKEFMEDLGLTSSQEFALWSPSAEPVNRESFSDDYGVSMRGMGTSFGTRNYFRTYANSDTYNTERLEYSRGPNALLFGDASIGGVGTVWTKQAQLNRKIATLQTKVDSWGTYRGNIDFNVSAGNRLALRFNALYGRTAGWRDVEETTQYDYHLAATVALAKNTQFRVEGQYSDKVRTSPFYPILDRASLWGGTVWTGPRTTGFPTGSTRVASTNYFVWNGGMPEAGIQNWINYGVSQGTSLALTTDERPGFANFPKVPSREFNPNAKSAEGHYKTYTGSVYLDQRVGEKLFLQVAYNHTLPKKTIDEVRWDDYNIDVNAKMPNGADNPYVGKVYSDEDTIRRKHQNVLHEVRAMAVWRFDNAWTSQNFSLLASRRLDEYSLDRFRQAPRGVKTRNADGSLSYYSSNSSADYIRVRRYWDDLDWDYGLAPASVTNAYGESCPIEYRMYESLWQDNKSDAIQLANVGKFLKGRLNTIAGYRYDRFERTDASTTARNSDGTPSAVTPTKKQINYARSPSIGAVYWLFKGIGLSANYAESFNPSTYGNETIYGQQLGPSEGSGIEAGLRFDLLDSRLTGSLQYYESKATGGAASVSTTATTYIDNMWNVVDSARVIGQSVRDTRSTKGRGYEAEVVYNPTRSWRMRLAAGVPYSEQADVFPYLRQYIAENTAVWQAAAATNPTVQTNLTNLTNWLVSNAAEGVRSTGSSIQWKANYFTSYRIGSGPLRGLTLGAGANYTGKRLIGKVTGDPYGNIWNDDILLFNALAKYDFRAAGLPMSMQLNVDNLLDNDQLDFREILSYGGVQYPGRYYYIDPRRFTLSATVRF